jgi:hypothetical protein
VGFPCARHSISNNQQGISNRTSERGKIPDIRPEKKRVDGASVPAFPALHGSAFFSEKTDYEQDYDYEGNTSSYSCSQSSSTRAGYRRWRMLTKSELSRRRYRLSSSTRCNRLRVGTKSGTKCPNLLHTARFNCLIGLYPSVTIAPRQSRKRRKSAHP